MRFRLSAPLVRGLFLLAVMVGLAGGCGRDKPRQTVLPAGASVLAIGDSVTYGTGAATGKDYPSQLAALTGWVIHNQGVPGDTTAGVGKRIEAALGETRPALVLLEIGGNDFLHRTPDGEVKEGLRDIVRLIRSKDIPVMLIAVPQFSPLGAMLGRLPDAMLYVELGREESVPVVRDVLGDALADETLRADAIHPNEAGYRLMAEGIADALARSGFHRR